MIEAIQVVLLLLILAGVGALVYRSYRPSTAQLEQAQQERRAIARQVISGTKAGRALLQERLARHARGKP